MTDIADTSIKMRHELVGILPRLTSFACRLTGSRDDGADLVQSACQRALESVHQWRPDARLDSWMYRIIHNLWIDGLRKQKGRRTWSLDGMPDAGPAIDGRTTVDARLMLQSVRKVIGELPQEQRDVLELIVVDGRSYKDAARRLDVPIGTVMSRLARARGKLKAEIGWPISAVLLGVALGLKTEDEALAQESQELTPADPIAELDRAARMAQSGPQGTDLGFANTIVVLAYVLGWMQQQRGTAETDDLVDPQTLDSLTAYLIGDDQVGGAQAEATNRAAGRWTGDEPAWAAAGDPDGTLSGETQGALPALESLEAQGAQEASEPATDSATIAAEANRHAAAGDDQNQLLIASLGDEALREHTDEALSRDEEPSLLRSNEAAIGSSTAGSQQIAGVIAGTAAAFQLQSNNSQTGLIGTIGGELTFADSDLLSGGADNQVLIGSAGEEVIFGSEAADLLEGGATGNTIYGGVGPDVIYGGDPTEPAPDIPDEIRESIFAGLVESGPQEANEPQQSAEVDAGSAELTTSDSAPEDSESEAGSAEPVQEQQTTDDNNGADLPPGQDPEHHATNGNDGNDLPPGQDPEHHAANGNDGNDVPPGQGPEHRATNENAKNDVPPGQAPEDPAESEDETGAREVESPDEGTDVVAGPPEDPAEDPADEQSAEAGDDDIDEVISDSEDDDPYHWWGYDDFLFGGQGNDLIWGGKGNDWLFGGQGRDQLHGGDDDDLIFGGTQDDRIWGGAGDDILVGGSGQDQAYFDGNRSDYLVSGSDQNHVTVTDLRAGTPGGWNFLIEIETLEFDDGSYATTDLVQEYQAWVSGRLLGEDDDGDPIALDDVVDSGGDDIDPGGTQPQVQGGQTSPASGSAGGGDPLPSIEQVVEDSGSTVQVM